MVQPRQLPQIPVRRIRELAGICLPCGSLAIVET
jgi:hypothetical protein